jgi:hypothetical protein
MTKLEAVNTILRGAGLPPVTSLTNPPVPLEATRAYQHLEETLSDVMNTDWTFNTVFDLTLSPDSTGTITGPEDMAYAEFSEEDLSKYQPVFRGPRVFNRKDNTYVFDKAITLRKLCSVLGWDEIPHQIQRYILKVAENDFVSIHIGDPSAVRHTQETLGKAWGDLQKYRVKIAPKPLFRVPSVLNRRASSGYSSQPSVMA